MVEVFSLLALILFWASLLRVKMRRWCHSKLGGHRSKAWRVLLPDHLHLDVSIRNDRRQSLTTLPCSIGQLNDNTSTNLLRRSTSGLASIRQSSPPIVPERTGIPNVNARPSLRPNVLLIIMIKTPVRQAQRRVAPL